MRLEKILHIRWLTNSIALTNEQMCVFVCMCVCVCVCVCVYVHVYLCCSGNKLPINSLKAEDILETTR